jgi:Peptidase family M23.
VDATATIQVARAPLPSWDGGSEGSPVGSAWDIEIGSVNLVAEATLTFRFDPAALPPDVAPIGLILAYLEPASDSWVPVPAAIDVSGTVTAQVTHLSTWQLFGLKLGLPFAAGTRITIGEKRLHADNWSSIRADDESSTVVRLQGSVSTLASIDLVVPSAGPEVRPIAAGVALVARAACETVIVDHGGGLWSEYIHLDVKAKVGDRVDPSKPIGYVMPEHPKGWTPPAECDGLESSAPHVHLALARVVDAAAETAEYLPLAGTVLCGHLVSESGDLAGLGTVAGDYFQVPACGGNANPPGPGPEPVLSGAWVSPAEGSTITTSTLSLTATATTRLASTKVMKVTFKLGVATDADEICSATKPAANGTWTCKADLWKAGAELGVLVLTFDIYDDAGDLTQDAGGIRTLSFAAPPGPAKRVKFTETCFYFDCPDPNEAGFTVTWASALGTVSGYRVYWGPISHGNACAGLGPDSYTLVTKLPPTALKWSGYVPFGDAGVVSGRWKVIAFNSAGSAAPAFSADWEIGIGCGPI